MKDFAGRTAFITGCASGIGFSISQTILGRGMYVAIADRPGPSLHPGAGDRKGLNGFGGEAR